jgi:hypothetical protein
MYEVSNLGNVRRTYKNGNVNLLKPSDDKDGYKRVSLSSSGNKKDFKVHRLVALAFIELVAGKLTVDHIDRDPANNNVSNLRWANQSEQNRNRCTYRCDIEETDQKLRDAIINKERYEKNKEALNAKNREYYQANKETIKARKCEKIMCECGASVCRSYITKHRKTDKHTKRLLNNLIEN